MSNRVICNILFKQDIATCQKKPRSLDRGFLLVYGREVAVQEDKIYPR